MMTDKAGPPFSSWDLFLCWAQVALKRNTAKNIVIKLAINTFIYHIWVEKNSRLHGGVPSSAHSTIQTILQDIRGRISGIPRLRKLYSENGFQFPFRA